MSSGAFACQGDFIYFTDGSTIYEYDTVTQTTVHFDAKSEGIKSMYIQGEHIYFSCDGLKRITKDGKKVETVFERKNGCLQLIVEEKYAYYLDSVEGSLYRRELKTDLEEGILTNVFSYHIDENGIYAVAKENDVLMLFVTGKEHIDFKQKELSFEPIKVYASDGKLFLSEKGTYQVIQLTDDTETRLPVYSLVYQMMDESLICLSDKSDKEENAGGYRELVLYDIATGEVEVVCENVYDFNIFENKYIFIETPSDEGVLFLIYDMETKETIPVTGKGE